MMGQVELDKIKELLKKENVDYKLIKHKRVHTAEESSKVRGIPLSQGVKSLILVTHEKKFVLCLVTGNRKIRLKNLKTILNTKDIRLADSEDVLRITGCEVGTVHPFGNLYKEKMEILMDKHVLDNETIDCSAGTFVDSIEMKCEEFIRVLKPRIEEFTIEKL